MALDPDKVTEEEIRSFFGGGRKVNEPTTLAEEFGSGQSKGYRVPEDGRDADEGRTEDATSGGSERSSGEDQGLQASQREGSTALPDET